MAAYEIMEELQNHPGIYIEVSFYEIYCGKLFDLLNNRENIICREDGKQKVNIVGLTERGVGSVDDIMNIISSGLQCRTSGTTGANADSSRSHAILQMAFKSR